MQARRIRTNHIALQIQDYPHPGEAIIFLHFSGTNLMMWPRALPYFQERYRIILVDLRGHGKSDRPPAGYHIDEMARDVLGVMQSLGLEQAHIVGSSLGAEVGLSLAANYPEKVRSLVCEGALCSEYGPYSAWEGTQEEFEAHVARELAQMQATPEPTVPSIEALVENRRQVFEKYGWWNDDVEAAVRYGAYQAADGQYTKGFAKQAMLSYMQSYFHCRFEDYYPKVQCPLLILLGELENPREMAAIESLCALAAQGQITVLPGWEHPYGWLLDPQPACQAVLKFLRADQEK